MRIFGCEKARRIMAVQWSEFHVRRTFGQVGGTGYILWCVTIKSNTHGPDLLGRAVTN